VAAQREMQAAALRTTLAPFVQAAAEPGRQQRADLVDAGLEEIGNVHGFVGLARISSRTLAKRSGRVLRSATRITSS